MNGHAVVIGGGIGGLLAAHALTGVFERVTVLERYRYAVDSDSGAPAARRGVPQSRCLHLLMAAGVAAFDELVPGWTKALVARGAVPFDASADAAMRFPGGWLPRSRSGITCYACSRALLEDVLRSEFAPNASTQVCEGQRVLGLLSEPDGRRVTGVRVVQGPGAITPMYADLVVDASGRSSMLPEWISELPNGARAPVEETVVESGTQYVSRWFHLDPDDAPDWHCLSVAPGEATTPRSAMMLRAENNCWGVVLLAPADEPMPSDDRDFLDFTDGLGDGKLRAALATARPLSPIHRYGSTVNRLRHYERCADWPSGLVALGDAVCALDPYCGLGMTAAARGAVLLRTRLTEGGWAATPHREWQFQRALAALNEQPWQLATGCDQDGRRGTNKATHVAGLYDVAPSSPEVAHALLAVQHLLRTPESLMELSHA
jgi:2-polyprenyl-6-methoxyphenol hydroxylase-like FAD-dependent oxidoreductase